jgi:hypothetical protein
MQSTNQSFSLSVQFSPLLSLTYKKERERGKEERQHLFLFGLAAVDLKELVFGENGNGLLVRAAANTAQLHRFLSLSG